MNWPSHLYSEWLRSCYEGNLSQAELIRWLLVFWLKPYVTLRGTKFQSLVWWQIAQINWGETRSYLELAEKINHKKSFRAVANACGANPWPLIIPCHRVVTSKFNQLTLEGIGGYSLVGPALKKRLLNFEKVYHS